MNRSAWITGAGRGIGRETARLFSKKGWSLFLSARTETDLAETARLCANPGVSIVTLPLDVCSPREIEAAVERMEQSGGIGVLVAAAGVGSFQPVSEIDPEEWERILAVNLTGTFLSMRSVLPGMLRRREGRLLLLASIAAKITLRGAAAYSASKAGVAALASCAREELRGTGVRVTVLYPGAVASPFWDSIGSNLDRKRMIPPARVAEELLRLAEELPGATTEELTILPPDGIL